MVWHIATFKVMEKENVKTVADAIRTLSDIVPGTLSFRVGENFGPDATVCIAASFDTEEHYKTFMSHPKHLGEVAPILFQYCGGTMEKALPNMVACDFAE